MSKQRANGNKNSGLAVADVPITSVIPYARNPRKDAAVAKVAASIREFGWRQPIVCDEAMTVIAGHTRLLAARQLGLASVPVHVAAGLTPAQIQAYRIADNRVAEDAQWDTDLLALEFADLAALDFDLSLTGFKPDEIAGLLPVTLGDDAFGALSNGDKPDFEQMTFTLHTSQAATVRHALDAAKAVGPFVDSPNENSNGNALARVAEVALGAFG